MKDGKRIPWDLLLLFAGAALLFTVGIEWGLPSRRGWAGDEILPRHVAKAVERDFSHGWHTKYPPLHYQVLAAVQAPFGPSEAGPRGVVTDSKKLLASRAVSLAMALGMLAAIFAIGARLSNRLTGLLAVGIVALSPPIVYFAKTANVEMPMMFWAAVGLWFLVRLLDEHRLRDYLGFAFCAAASIVTKDQAYALWLLTPFVIVPALARRRREERPEVGASEKRIGLRELFPTLFDVRLLGVLVVGVVVAAFAYRLPWNWTGLVRHVETLLGPQSQEAKAFPATFAGYGACLIQNGRDLAFCLGGFFWLVPFAVLSAITLLRGKERQGYAALGVVGLSYFSFFLVPILFSRDRYVLPLVLVFAPLCARALQTWLAPDPSLVAEIRVRRLVVGVGLFSTAVSFGLSLWNAVALDAKMVGDTRYRIERTLRKEGVEKTALGLGRAKHLPRLAHYASWARAESEIRRRRPSRLVVNLVDLRTEGEQKRFKQLADGALGYRDLDHEPAPSPWLQMETFGSLTSLVFVDPPIVILHRVAASGPPLGGSEAETESTDGTFEDE